MNARCAANRAAPPPVANRYVSLLVDTHQRLLPGENTTAGDNNAARVCLIMMTTRAYAALASDETAISTAGS